MKNIKWFGLLIFLGLAAAVFTSRPASAQSPTPIPVTDDQVNAVARELYCPVCENIPLDVCPTQACAQWRDLIRLKLSQGWTKDQIKTYFANQYGDRVLEEPPRQGLHLLVYILPPIFFLAGVFLVWRAFRSGRKPAQVTAVTEKPSVATEDPDVLKRIEEDLRRREKQG